MDPFWFSAGLAVLLLILSAFFSSSEAAFTAMDELRIKNVRPKKSRRRIRLLLRSGSLLLITILLGNTAVNTAAATLLGNLFGIANPALSIVAVTGVLLVFAEITPKTFTLLRLEQTARFNSVFLYPVYVLLSPLTRPLDALINRTIGAALERRKRRDEDETETDHLAALASVVAREGIFDPDERKLIEGVISFAGREVWNIMTPRTQIVSVEKNAGVRDMARLFKKGRLSKLPVFDKTDDNIAGVVYLKNIMTYLYNPEQAAGKKAADIMDPMFFVPETKTLPDMLEDFRTRQIRIAAVVDEYGSCLGIVTLADVLGEIAGEIMDESFRIENKIIRLSPKRHLVQGDVSLADFNSHFGTDLASAEFETLAGFVIQTAGDIPDRDYALTAGKYRIVIKEKSEKRIERFIVEEI